MGTFVVPRMKDGEMIKCTCEITLYPEMGQPIHWLTTEPEQRIEVWDASDCDFHRNAPVTDWTVLPMGRVPDPFGTRDDDEVWDALWLTMLDEAYAENEEREKKWLNMLTEAFRLNDEFNRQTGREWWARQQRIRDKKEQERRDECNLKHGEDAHPWVLTLDMGTPDLVCKNCRRKHPLLDTYGSDWWDMTSAEVRVRIGERVEPNYMDADDIFIDLDGLEAIVPHKHVWWYEKNGDHYCWNDGCEMYHRNGSCIGGARPCGAVWNKDTQRYDKPPGEEGWVMSA